MNLPSLWLIGQIVFNYPETGTKRALGRRNDMKRVQATGPKSTGAGASLRTRILVWACAHQRSYRSLCSRSTIRKQVVLLSSLFDNHTNAPPETNPRN
ncbi:hypothetical protein GWI33_001972 [Rhynchophorus ferrugineus]|uniref:Uncharacterized protein n=1 Tax=Rhynchophorus ferrugineus TaxID=354439 RepID=A0A834MG33_RHYFE|nr:hypothetical protein GWI33_001972 [Rhynchophorus ferrugineus]